MTKKEARQQVKEWMKKLDKNYIEKADRIGTEIGEECRSSIVYWERNHGSETNSCFR